MKTMEVKLVGMGRPQSFTCELLDSDENCFWAKNGLGLDKFNDLWNYCKGHWNDKKIAEIKYEKLSEDGTPINAIVVGVREAD